MSTRIRTVDKNSYKVNYKQVNETVYSHKNYVVKKPNYKKYQTRKSKQNVVTEPFISNNKIKPIPSPPLEGYDEPVDTERERDLDIADDYIPYYEDDQTVPGDIHNDVIENSFGHSNKRSKIISLTQVQGLENGNPRKHLNNVVSESDVDFKVLKIPKVASSTLTHLSLTSDAPDAVDNIKMLQDDPYTKRDYIVQQRIHRSNAKEIQARKGLTFLKLVRDKENEIKEAKHVYEETLFLEGLTKPEESSDTNKNPNNIIDTGTDNEVELSKETKDIIELQENVFYGEEIGGLEKSFIGNRRPLINIGSSHLRAQVNLPNQLSPRGKFNFSVVWV